MREETTIVPPSEYLVSEAGPETGNTDKENDAVRGNFWNGGAGKTNTQHDRSPFGKYERNEPEREGDMVRVPDSEVDGDRGESIVNGGRTACHGSGGVSRDGKAIHSQPSAATHGYASLRKIREQKPLPTVRQIRSQMEHEKRMKSQTTIPWALWNVELTARTWYRRSNKQQPVD